MTRDLKVPIAAQPDDVTCGPTCLQAIYSYYDDDISLHDVIEETATLREGGTLDVYLANHALRRGYNATILTYNLQLFDPTWFGQDHAVIAERLRKQAQLKPGAKLQSATEGYLEFISLGGKVDFEVLTPNVIRRYLRRRVPILTGLNATFLYGTMREDPDTYQDDDIGGEPVGHFVVLSGYNKQTRDVQVSDPYRANPYDASGIYSVDIRRLIGAILLGIVTYDANLLIITRGSERRAQAKTAKRSVQP